MKMKNNLSSKKGFTLIELLIVIAIIGILASVVTVSMTGAREKAKKASALTTASSVLPEIVICEDDGGIVSAPSAGATICSAVGHSATWPNILTKTGWQYSAPTAATPNANIGTMEYKLIKSGQTDIKCNVSQNGCD